VATEEIRAAEQITGHPTMYAFNITGDLAGLRRRHDLVVEAGGRCVMLNVPVMGLPALAWLREFAEVPIHGHRAGLAGSMRSPALGMSYRVWQQLARLAGADHLHASGLGSKFYETDDEVAANVRACSNRSATPSARYPPSPPGRTSPRPRPPTRRCAPPTCSCSPEEVSPRTPTDPPPEYAACATPGPPPSTGSAAARRPARGRHR
jgi:ribulose-bisphosphate carboxylase large chain